MRMPKEFDDICKKVVEKDKCLEPIIERIKEVKKKYRNCSNLLSNYSICQELKDDLIFFILAKSLPKIIEYSDNYELSFSDLFSYTYCFIIESISEDDNLFKKPYSLVSRFLDRLYLNIEKEFLSDRDIEICHLQDYKLSIDEFSYPEIPVFNKIAKEKLYCALNTLTDREIFVLTHRSGFYCDPLTLEEVGRYYNVFGERIRQVELKALRKLCSPYRKRHLIDFEDTYNSFIPIVAKKQLSGTGLGRNYHRTLNVELYLYGDEYERVEERRELERKRRIKEEQERKIKEEQLRKIREEQEREQKKKEEKKKLLFSIVSKREKSLKEIIDTNKDIFSDSSKFLYENAINDYNMYLYTNKLIVSSIPPFNSFWLEMSIGLKTCSLTSSFKKSNIYSYSSLMSHYNDDLEFCSYTNSINYELNQKIMKFLKYHNIV